MSKEVLGEAFSFIEKVAPIVASVIGSPAAGAATLVGMNLLSHAFGINPDETDKLGTTILADPDARGKLGQIEQILSPMLKGSMRMPSKAEVNVKLEWCEAN